MKQTALLDEHKKLNAVMTDFAGWQMPLQYEGIVAEHMAVRQAAGLFDVSHMGELMLTGKESTAFLQATITRDISKLKEGGIAYTLLCHEQGGVLDDLLVYCLSEDRFMLVVNASNTKKVKDWLQNKLLSKEEQTYSETVTLKDMSDTLSLIALQGPAALAILQPLTSASLQEIRPFHFRDQINIAGYPVLLSRTGYTGEDGFELYISPEHAPSIWRTLLEAGQSSGLKPAGLGARDTLRLEAAMPLYGHEIDETISPLEAGLRQFVSFNKTAFSGKQALQQIAADYDAGKRRQRIGFQMIKRIPAREGSTVLINGRKAGYVTSGGFMPWLKISAGMALVDQAVLGGDVDSESLKIGIEIRGKIHEAVVARLPFYQRAKPGKKY